MGSSRNDWNDYMFNKVNKTLTKEELLKGVTDRIKLYFDRGEIDLMPGANKALQFANDSYKVELASGSYKNLLYRAVKVNKWDNIFDEILSSDDLKRGKPFPEIYVEVMKRLNTAPQETVVLEDSKDGINAGINAGANVIAVPSKEAPIPKDILTSAIAVLKSLVELPETIIKINKGKSAQEYYG